MARPRQALQGRSGSDEANEDIINFSDIEEEESGFSFLQRNGANKKVKRSREAMRPEYPVVSLELKRLTKRAKSYADSALSFEAVINSIAAKELDSAGTAYDGYNRVVPDTVAFWWEQFQPLLADSLKGAALVDNTRNLKNETLRQQKRDLEERLSRQVCFLPHKPENKEHHSLQTQQQTWHSLSTKHSAAQETTSAGTQVKPSLYRATQRLDDVVKATPQLMSLRVLALAQNLHGVQQTARRTEVATNLVLQQIDTSLFKGYKKQDAKSLIRSLVK